MRVMLTSKHLIHPPFRPPYPPSLPPSLLPSPSKMSAMARPPAGPGSMAWRKALALSGMP